MMNEWKRIKKYSQIGNFIIIKTKGKDLMIMERNKTKG